MSGRAGFGNSPRSFSTRVTVVGHASARWRGAKTVGEANRKNYELSVKRADAVFAIVETELRAHYGPKFPIEYAARGVDAQKPAGVMIGAYGQGSDVALRTKPRTDNSDYDRRVEVRIERIVTHYTTGNVSLPPLVIPGRTTEWALGVTKLRSTALGYANVGLEIRLRNRRTDKAMFATATLHGGGIGGGVAKAGSSLKKQAANQGKNQVLQAAADFLGRGEVFFSTSEAMIFSDFDGQFIRLGKVLASLGIKAVHSYAVFPSIKHSPSELVFQHKTSLGFIDLEGWVATGRLTMVGPHPGDYLEYEQDGVSHESYDRVWEDSLIVNFKKTGSWDVRDNAERIRTYVKEWLARNG